MKRERLWVKSLWPRSWRRRWAFPIEVRLTRYAPRGKPLDDDNLRGALKAVRDQVAAQLGVDDGRKDLVRWEYSEERGPYAVEIAIRELP